MVALQCDVSKSLQWLRGRGELCDVVVVGGNGQHTAAHSCVLAAHSTVIAAALQGRLAAHKDWSVMRPLVITVGDVTSATTAAAAATGGVGGDTTTTTTTTTTTNIMEILIALLYGEQVDIPSALVSSLLHHAQLLGLSHHIYSTLQTSGGAGLPVGGGGTHSTRKRKHTRKPVLENAKTSAAGGKNEKDVYVGVCSDGVWQGVGGAAGGDKGGVAVTCGVPGGGQFEARGVEMTGDFEVSVCEKVCERVNDFEGKGFERSSHFESKPCQGTNNFETAANFNEKLGNVNARPCDEKSTTSETIEKLPSIDVLCDNTDTRIDTDTMLELSLLCEDVDRDMPTAQPWTHTPQPTQTQHDTETAEILGLVITAREVKQQETQQEAQQEVQQKKQKGRIIGKGLLCEVCGMSFQRCGDLIKHVQHSQHYSQQCPLCFVQVREEESQRLHFAQHDHNLPFFCVYCDLRFRTRAALTMHAPKHSTTKPFVCGDCGRGFKWRHALQAHSYTHSATNRLLCDVCGFSSKYVTTFKAHLLQHTGSFFPCPFPGCSFSSSRKTHLNDHYTTHSKLRVHQCEICGHSFSHAKNMRRHMKLHTPSASLLQCSSVSNLQCSFQTTRFDKLRNHLSKKHSIDHTTATFAAIKQTSASPIVTGFGHKQQEGLADAQPDLCVDRMDGSDVAGLDSKVCQDRVVMMGDVPQSNFSVLVVSPEIVELADIEGLGDAHTDAHAHTQTHTDGGKRGETQNVSEISDTDGFPADFLVNHELLLDKADGVDGQVEGAMHPLPPDLLGGKMEAVEGGVLPYVPEPCVLEVIEEEEGMEEGKEESERVREREREQEREREKQCIDSLNILEFMLDNVAS